MTHELSDLTKRLARELLDAPAVQEHLDEAHRALISTASDVDPRALRLALLAALGEELRDRTTTAARDARQAPAVTWQQLADTLDMTVSGIRHRYDARTAQARRAYDRRRRR